ncbi:MAG TPA: hypothetical protein VL086_13230 [Candidatus Nitrosotalea sp.]|nr:hypothetical protein [Candidatus Nitrosotalea sp.]
MRRPFWLSLATLLLITLGGAGPTEAATTAFISRFTITRDGQPFFDDTFSGESASLATPRLAGGEPTAYFVVGSIPDGSVVHGRLSVRSANGALSATADGEPRRQAGARLLTNNDPKNARAGLKSGFIFSMSALFEFVVPGGPVEGYGIRFGDFGSGHKPAHVIHLFVYRNEADGLVIRYLLQDFAAGTKTIVEDVPVSPAAGDQIRLTLSRASLQTSDVTAQYQFLKDGTPASAPLSVGTGVPIFSRGENTWTRAEFFVFEQAPAPGR